MEDLFQLILSAAVLDACTVAAILLLRMDAAALTGISMQKTVVSITASASIIEIPRLPVLFSFIQLSLS